MRPIHRVLVLGNSITLHGPLAQVGWPHNWGMAASRMEKDYVHRLKDMLAQDHPDVEMLYFNISGFERSYPIELYEDASMAIELARQWQPDIVILRIGENVDDTKAVENQFGMYYEGLARRLGAGSNTKVICVNGFWRNQHVNEMIRKAAKRLEYPFVDITPLGDEMENRATGFFQNPGVASHPGDLGMERIAQAIMQSIRENEI